jgi:uncharacterized protein YecE (DUF72 family)
MKKSKLQWHIGCSGFSYKEWKDVFYPPKLSQNKWFNYYTDFFDTIELNVTFYRFPQLTILQGWYDKSPDHFLFSVKVPRLITHYKQLKETEDLLTDFYTTCKTGLRDKLGPILFQFPPRFHFTPDNLEKVIKSIDLSFTNVVEFRHKSWWCKEVYTQLKKHGIIFCGISYPGLPADVIATAPVLYYRFHGVPKLYYSSYGEEALEKIANDILQQHGLKNIFCFFNNTATPGAIENAQWLQQYVSAPFKRQPMV